MNVRKRLTDDERFVRAKLREAFPLGYFEDAASAPKLSANDLNELRKDLPLLNDDDLRRYLPAVLDDLIVSTSRDFLGDLVVYFLNPHLQPVSIDEADLKKYLNAIRPKLGSEKTEQLHDLLTREIPTVPENQTKSHEYFATFSLEECRAVFEWLLVANKWSEFEFISEDFDKAIAFWSRKVAQPI